MAVKSVIAIINGVSVPLALDESSGKYVGTLTAPSETSWNEENHQYGISVKAEDLAGNSVTKDRTDSDLGGQLAVRVKETTLPTITILTPSGGALVTNAKEPITFQLRDTGAGIDITTLSFKIDDDEALTNTAEGMVCTEAEGGYDCTYTPQTALADGEHTVTINVSDNDDNAAEAASSTYKVDTVPPELNVLTPADKLITNDAHISITGTTSDDTGKLKQIEVFLNETSVGLAAITDNSWSLDTDLNIEGDNVIKVVATDNSGLTTTVERTVTLDTHAPVITDVVLSATTVNVGKTFTITVTVTD